MIEKVEEQKNLKWVLAGWAVFFIVAGVLLS